MLRISYIRHLGSIRITCRGAPARFFFDRVSLRLWTQPLPNPMATPVRRGMIIKNANARPVDIGMTSRNITLLPGEETMITAEEVRDPEVRKNLQVRAISIVRPVTTEEEKAFQKELAEAGSVQG